MLECQAMIKQLAQQRDIHMTFPQFDIPYFVLADRTRLKQVLINLLSNAIKYNIKQGTVEVKCTESTPGRICVSIRDSGAGLYPEQLAQLFSRSIVSDRRLAARKEQASAWWLPSDWSN